MHTESGFLSETEYLELPQKLSSLPQELRPAVYAVFRDYKTKRRERGLYDLPDLIFHLLQCLRSGHLNCSRVDRLVVDGARAATLHKLHHRHAH